MTIHRILFLISQAGEGDYAHTLYLPYPLNPHHVDQYGGYPVTIFQTDQIAYEVGTIRGTTTTLCKIEELGVQGDQEDNIEILKSYFEKL